MYNLSTHNHTYLGIIAGGAILIGLSDAESNLTAEMVAGGTAIALALIAMLYEIIMIKLIQVVELKHLIRLIVVNHC